MWELSSHTTDEILVSLLLKGRVSIVVSSMIRLSPEKPCSDVHLDLKFLMDNQFVLSSAYSSTDKPLRSTMPLSARCRCLLVAVACSLPLPARFRCLLVAIACSFRTACSFRIGKSETDMPLPARCRCLLVAIACSFRIGKSETDMAEFINPAGNKLAPSVTARIWQSEPSSRRGTD